MHIHTKTANETVANIAEKYTVSEDILRKINLLGDDTPTEGEELLVLVPTRTYTARTGDTVERIALRFGVSPVDIISNNPWIINRSLKRGEEVALKFDQKPYGMAAANGYFYKGCTMADMERFIPYLTYITFASAVADSNKISKLFDDGNYIKSACEKNKIPLLRVFDKYPQRYNEKSGLENYAEDLIEQAMSGGYKGLVIDTCSLSQYKKIFSEFLINLRRLMIGNDLILITEIDENSPPEFSEFADASVIYYPKYAMKNPPDFKNGENKIYSDFACNCESARTFIDLPSLVMGSEGFTCIEEGLRKARMCSSKIERNEKTLLSHFHDKKQGEYRFASLRNIEALYKIVKEYDYMGVCFDIMRTPLSYIMMYNALFKTAYHTNVRSREGCSRAGED